MDRRYRPRPQATTLPRPRPSIWIDLTGPPRARILAGDRGAELALRALAHDLERIARSHLAALRCGSAA